VELTVLPPRYYYLSEGTTVWQFDTQIVVTNPNDEPAAVELTFMRPDGGTVTTRLDVPARNLQVVSPAALNGLRGVDFATVVESLDDLPLLVERTMRWNGDGYGAHSETAVTATSTTWYFAEGVEGERFNTYILVANPGAREAQVTLTLLPTAGNPVTRSYRVGPTSRLTIPMSAIVGPAIQSFAVVLESTEPVTAERSLYFSSASRAWEGGHAAAGATAAGTTWLFAEGSTWEFDAYLLLANPGSQAATATVTYRTYDGLTIVREHVVGARTRATVDIASEDARLAMSHFWVSVDASQPIVAERALYWPRPSSLWQDGHVSGGAPAAATGWGFADALANGPTAAETFLLLANPSDQAATVHITATTTDGQSVSGDYMVPAGARTTVWANALFGDVSARRFWILVESTNGVPVLAERSMYWNALGQRWAAGTTVFGTPLR
jgi:hypothetical protein